MVLDLDGAAAYPGGVLAIGTFDGVHLAHRALLRSLLWRWLLQLARLPLPVRALWLLPHSIPNTVHVSDVLALS